MCRKQIMAHKLRLKVKLSIILIFNYIAQPWYEVFSVDSQNRHEFIVHIQMREMVSLIIKHPREPEVSLGSPVAATDYGKWKKGFHPWPENV